MNILNFEITPPFDFAQGAANMEHKTQNTLRLRSGRGKHETMNNRTTTLIFDWGDTIMRDFDLPGPMMNWDKVEWIPGAEESLKVLSQKFTCIIATSAGHSGTPEMIAALKRVGADRYFHHFVSSKDLGYDKPNPLFFQAVAKKFAKPPNDCVMIGNLYEKDIIGAKKAGMQTIFFNEKKLEGNFPDADVIIFGMNELQNFIP